ncbi:uncharacterized protein AB9W97_016750 [Spinachia spinachia]
MAMRSVEVITLLWFCSACLSPVYGTAYFVSKNFHNVLHWNASQAAHPGEEVRYSVWYSSDAADQKFRVKGQCQNITALVCDLTAETPSVHDVNYRARVYCDGDLCGKTTRFKPIAQTVLGPPVLSKHSTVSSFHVNATVPLGPDGVSVADIIIRSKKLPYKSGLVYTLKITEPPWATKVNETTTGRFVIGLKNNGTEYCGYVVYKPKTESGRPESERAHFCVTLPGDPLALLPWLLVSAALLAAVTVTSAVAACRYVNGGKGESMPQTLVTSSSDPPRAMLAPDRYLRISKAEVCIESEKTVYATIQAQPDRSGGYAPQDVLGQNGQDGTGSDERSLTPNPEDTSAHSSGTYVVVAVQEQSGDVPRATSHPPSLESQEDAVAGPGPTLGRMQAPPRQEPAEDNAVGRLRLQTAQDANGRLVLPLLLSQLQSSSAGDGGTPLGPEWKPLLSDLIDSGTGGAVVGVHRGLRPLFFGLGVRRQRRNHANAHLLQRPARPVASGRSLRPAGMGGHVAGWCRAEGRLQTKLV